jgi:glycosyltransferase involved in cell wall biosynthesis
MLSLFYYPEPNDVKTHQLAQDLVKRGHEVVSITTFPNYPEGKIYAGYQQRWRQWENIDGVKVVRLPLYPDHSRSGIKRALSYLSFMTSAGILAPLMSGPADILYVYHPPLTTGLAGLSLSFWRKLPFVYEILDLWPDTLSATGMLSNPHALKIIGHVAKFVYGQASAITVTSNGFKQNLIAKQVDPQKVHVIPNWADETIYYPVERDLAWGEKYKLTGKFNVMFAGNIGLAQGLHTLIDAAKQLQDIPDLQIVIIGGGVALADLKTQAEAYRLFNVLFIDRHPPQDMPAFFAWSNALLIHVTQDPLFTITIPQKTQAYMACGRPIIAAIDGDGAEVIYQANAGLICTPENPESLAKAIRIIYTMTASERETMGKAGREAYLTHYRRQVAVDHYEHLFYKIITHQPNLLK